MRYEAMIRSSFSGVRGGRRRRRGFVTPAICLLMISMVMAGCSLDSPSSPNSSGSLTGQTTGQQYSFSGTIKVTSLSTTLAANDTATITVTAEVKDAQGNPVQNFVSVTFRTDLGGFLTAGGTAPAVATVTSNGEASVQFQSVNRQAGTAHIVASVGDTTGTTKVVLEPAAVEGAISLSFGTAGTGTSTKIGQTASQNDPLDVEVSVKATDFVAGDPIAGATVRFRIVDDTTDEGSLNDPARWVASDSTYTGPDGVAVNVLRVYGAGIVVMEADLVDPVSGDTVWTSNRIILTSKATLIVKLTFSDGSTTFTGNSPYSVGLETAVFDATNSPREGLQVYFRTTGDPAALAKTVVVTDAQGRGTNSVTILDNGGGESVTIHAELRDADNTVIGVAATVIASGS